MDRFQAMQVFVRVVDANSFTRAADSLSLPRTTVTTIIQNLERLLGVRLLNRTTRRDARPRRHPPPSRSPASALHPDTTLKEHHGFA